MDHNDRYIDDVLKMRYEAQPRSNLEYRIIEAAKRDLIVQNPDKTSFVQDLWTLFKESLYLPRPALSLAVVLIIGTGVGVSSFVSLDNGSAAQNSIENYFIIQDVSYGDF